MKLLTIIYDSGIDETMMDLVESLGVSGWTKLSHLLGSGGRGPKLNSPVFPGTNHLLLVAVPDDQVERIRLALRRLQSNFRLKPGITLLCQDVDTLP